MSAPALAVLWPVLVERYLRAPWPDSHFPREEIDAWYPTLAAYDAGDVETVLRGLSRHNAQRPTLLDVVQRVEIEQRRRGEWDEAFADLATPPARPGVHDGAVEPSLHGVRWARVSSALSRRSDSHPARVEARRQAAAGERDLDRLEELLDLDRPSIPSSPGGPA